MIITLKRFAEDAYGTMGELTFPGARCYILERAPSGPHPRIPAGDYSLLLRRYGTSRLDARMRGFMGAEHIGMIEVADVEGRTDILIHPANDTQELLGCLAPGMRYSESNMGSGGHAMTFWLEESRKAYQRIYPPIRDAIKGEGASIVITDPVAAPIVDPLVA